MKRGNDQSQDGRMLTAQQIVKRGLLLSVDTTRITAATASIIVIIAITAFLTTNPPHEFVSQFRKPFDTKRQQEHANTGSTKASSCVQRPIGQ